uniref:1-alkyl-2-acetylglycerophosphocholine esterase n=1 Tax=Serinus canaria TaxID=9135 RepID=A0A8C9MUV3_SERCA
MWGPSLAPLRPALSPLLPSPFQDLVLINLHRAGVLGLRGGSSGAQVGAQVPTKFVLGLVGRGAPGGTAGVPFPPAHRDHSAATTYFCPAEAGTEEWIPFQRVPQGQKEFYFRNKQVHQRAQECVRALRLFQGIAGGRSAPSILPQDWDLSVLKDNLDLTKVAVMGHSFGGVTAVLALVKEPSFRCAVALDAWMFPLENLLYPEVPSPVLFINTEKFQTPESAAKMKRLSSRNSQTRIVTVLGTVHEDQTDFAFLPGKLFSLIFGRRGTLEPRRALAITSQAALAFLQRHLKLQEQFGQWDELLEGVGDSVAPDVPFGRSHL